MSKKVSQFDRYLAAQLSSGDPWDCWECPGFRNPDGYVVANSQGKAGRAHRLAFERWHGRPPAPGLEIMHLCDNPPCINPCHLNEGTHRENMLDSHAKGRSTTVIPTLASMAKQKANTPRGDRHWMKRREKRLERLGEANGNHVLTWEQVREIRRLRAEEGWLYKDLAARFSVSLVLIGMIVRNRIWHEDGYERRRARERRRPSPPAALTMPQKGHGGEANGNRRLTWADAREIRRLHAECGLTQAALAALYGVWQSTISMILQNRTWKEDHHPSS